MSGSAGRCVPSSQESSDTPQLLAPLSHFMHLWRHPSFLFLILKYRYCAVHVHALAWECDTFILGFFSFSSAFQCRCFSCLGTLAGVTDSLKWL